MKLALALLGLSTLLPADPLQAPEAASLSERLEALRARANLPALGAALVTLEGLQGPWVVGTRRAKGPELASVHDLWHLGSCTKSMTATLVALLVARGDLAWDRPIGEYLPPEITGEMDAAYDDVTLVELLAHRAGLSGEADLELLQELRFSEQEPRHEQRAKIALAALSRAPSHPPRSAFVYANDGFVIAGYIAELVTRRSWEELVHELLFEPLGMSSAGFGAPGTRDAVDQPRGHLPTLAAIEPGPLADNPLAYGPAGTVHASLTDWAKYARLHLEGVHGDVALGKLTLTKDAFARLHSPYAGPGQAYGSGWVVEKHPWAGGDGSVLWHNGSNTMWYSLAKLGLSNGVAVLVTTNVFTPESQKAVEEAAELVLAEHARGVLTR